LRESDEIKKILADMKVSQPALGWSHPDWLAEKWRQRFGLENTLKLLEWNNLPPKTYARVNALKFGCSASGEASGPKFGEVGDLLSRWREEGVEYDFLTRDWTGENLAFALKAHPSLARLGSFQDGWFYVQDPSTLLAPAMVEPQPQDVILDLCAAPGGKTTFLAQLMANQGEVVASDLDAKRLKLVKDNCARLGVTSVETCLPEALNRRPAAEFDRILVDAPCSNTGVLRRRVDLRWRIQAAELERLRTTQLDLLVQSASRLKPGGILVYSTCSLEPEENSDVVKQFLGNHPGFALEKERQLLPFADGVDGAYVARLKKLN
jgi:16S rRNA (cytosine967-C5)-methyltransferase